MQNKAHTPREERSGRAVAEYAGRRHGVVSTAELRDLGVGRALITRWIDDGRLRRLHRGVYAVGAQPLTSLSRFRAAVLACGEGAALSHRSAAVVWRLRKRYDGPIEVTVPKQRRSRTGIRVHTGAAAVTELHGIAVTTPAQTIIDLADVLIARSVEQALAIAERDELVCRKDLRPIHGRRGAGVIARLTAADDVAFTRSQLEEWFLAIIRPAGLPEPRLNQIVHGIEVDAYWPAHGVVVELDGWTYHRDRAPFRDDRTKQNLLMARGLKVLRFTGDETVHYVTDMVAGALNSASPAAVRA